MTELESRDTATRLDRRGDPLPPRALARLGTHRLLHASRVASLGFSPDGRTLVSSDTLGAVRLWETPSGRALGRLDVEPGSLGRVAFWPDDETLLTVEDGNARLWNRLTRKPFAMLFENLFGARVVLAERAGLLAAARPGEPAIRLWQGRSWRERTALTTRRLGEPELAGAVDAMSFSLDGRTLAAATGDARVRVWDVGSGACLREIATPALAVALSRDGAILATIDRVGTTRTWELASGRERAAFVIEGATALTFASDENVLLVVAANAPRAGVEILDLATGARRRRAALNATAFALAPEGRTFAVGNANGAIDLLALEGDDPFVHENRVRAATFSPDGATIATGSQDCSVRICDAATGEPFRELVGHSAEVVALAFSPDGARLVSSAHDRTVRTWTRDRAEEKTLEISYFSVESVAFSPSSDRLALGGRPAVWSMSEKGPELLKRKGGGYPSQVRGVAWSPDGSAIVFFDAPWPKSLASDTRQRPKSAPLMWTGDDRHVPLDDVALDAESLAFVPGRARTAAIGLRESAVVVFDFATSQTLHRFDAAPESVVAASAKLIAFASRAAAPIELRALDSGEPLAPLAGHEGGVRALAFSPDCSRLVSVGADGTALVWAVAE